MGSGDVGQANSVMKRSVGPSHTKPLTVVALLICAAHIAAVFLLGHGPVGSLVSNLLQVAASVVAASLCFDASRRSTGFARRMWTLVAIAFGIWSIAQATYAYHENWLGTEVPRPSWTHFLFRLYGAPWLMALLLARDAEEKSTGPDWQQSLDFAQVGILFMFFYFDLYFVPGQNWHGLTELALWGFFDLSDLENWSILAAFVARAKLSGQAEEKAISRRLVPYLLAYATASSLANYLFSFWALTAGRWPDVLFTFSLTMGSLLAGTWRKETTQREPEIHPSRKVYWAPAILPLLTLALALLMARQTPEVAFVAVFGSVTCFGARLLITLYRQERLMAALRSSEMRYANLVEMAPDAIFVHVEGRITFANPATARIFGFSSPQDVVGRHLLEFAPPGKRDQVAKKLAGLGVDRSARRWIALRPDGIRIPLDVLGMVLGPNAGETGPSQHLVMARDVSVLERAETEREALIRNLEAKNAELERFTYTVSHDLRSPLITVTGFLSQVEDAAARGDMATLRGDIERIRRATKKMDLLLHDLLELSRIGHVLGPPAPIPFEPLCREAIDIIGGRLRKGGVRIEIEPGLPMLLGDRNRLLEVVQNLLDNAAKFMGDQQNPLVRIGVRSDQGQIVFFIQDNGIGIDPRHHASIFGLFDKLDQKADGTGVGLALVKRIIELHAGRIWVESEGLGAGATFVFTLPLASALPPVEDAPPILESP